LSYSTTVRSRTHHTEKNTKRENPHETKMNIKVNSPPIKSSLNKKIVIVTKRTEREEREA